MALRHFTCNALTGGVAGSLDYLWPGDDLVPAITILDGYLCTTIITDDEVYFHRYDASSALSESDPDVIKPDSNTGNGRWIRVQASVFAEEIKKGSISTKSSTVSGDKYLIFDGEDSDTPKVIDHDNLPTGSGSGHTVQDETVPLTDRANLNFTGDAVTATDNAGNNATDVTINHQDISGKEDVGVAAGLISTHASNGDAHHNEIHAVTSHSDIDTTGVALNDVLKWNGTNFVPGTAGDTTEFTFSIDSFSDGISDTLQLIGSGTWKAVGAVSFTATYSNAPGGMTAEVALSGSSVAWSGNLSMTPVTGPETNTEAVAYPSTRTGTITFTLSQSADATEDTESVSFSNTMRYGNNVSATPSETIVEGLTEVSGPNESRSQTFSNLSATDYLYFAYANALSNITQVRINTGYGYVTASFNSTRSSVAPTIVTSGLTTVENSAGFIEAFKAIVSTDTGLGDGSNDFQTLTSSTAQNYIYWGELNVDAVADGTNQYTQANVKDNVATEPGQVASNTISSRSMTVNAGAGEYTYIAYPARLGALTSILIGGFESIGDFWIDAGSGTELTIRNDGGFEEDYYVYVSKNPGFTDPTEMTVSI